MATKRTGREQTPTLEDFWAPAWQRARVVTQATTGKDLERSDYAGPVTDSVNLARRWAEQTAAGNMRIAVALALGTTPTEIEKDKAGYRMIAEDTHRLLAMVGLRAGEAVEVEMSDRMQDFLARFFGPGGRRREAANPKRAAARAHG